MDDSFQREHAHFIILVPYRSRGIQNFRRKQLITMINNITKFFEQNKIKYNIVISEQNNDKKFNRGLLLNVAFLESEKMFSFSKTYLHMNVDYTIDLSRNFPKELLDFKNGFVDLYRPPYPVLGGACAFDTESYKAINGFPNDLHGWGGDDWAIYNRISHLNINIFTPPGLYNSGFIINENVVFNADQSSNQYNMQLALRNDYLTNGLNNINYNNEGYGEFHIGNVVHFLIN